MFPNANEMKAKSTENAVKRISEKIKEAVNSGKNSISIYRDSNIDVTTEVQKKLEDAGYRVTYEDGQFSNYKIEW